MRSVRLLENRDLPCLEGNSLDSTYLHVHLVLKTGSRMKEGLDSLAALWSGH